MTEPRLGPSDWIEQLRQWNEQIKAMPEPIAYIVLDHNWSHRLPVVEGHDAKGQRYILTSPAVLDEFRHVRVSDRPLDPMAGISGIPVFRREHMHKAWPDA